MKKIWGGRFRTAQDPFFEEFNASFPFDACLVEYEIQGTLAHARALARAGVLKPGEASRIARELRRLLQRTRKGPLPDGKRFEDVHAFVEHHLTERLGDLGRKIHTGRSRNEQVALDLRLFVQHTAGQIQSEIRQAQRALVRLAENHQRALMPGYTHLQRAQPLLLAHYLLAYCEMLERDHGRLADCRKRTSVSPLGSGALAGTSFPVHRRAAAQDLGLRETSQNSLDAVSDRDFLVEFIFDLSLLMVHLSRWAEDFILFTTSEFGFLELSDAVSAGSSLMPQKKNPDALELIRGKCGRVTGSLVALLTLLKGIPFGYNKDLQEDKPPLLDAVRTTADCLNMMELVLKHTRVQEDRMRQASSDGELMATDLAEELVRRGVPFRTAHEQVGKLVRRAREKNVPLRDLPSRELRAISPLLVRRMGRLLDPEASVARRNVPGGTAPAQVRRQLSRWKRRLRI